ncbi:AAA family ATPase [Sorangium sp. So ce1151]|uniref:AAA family ATPase n=1 Tax=Sorangium sp. So ce1151 TaxID=3133332 RepID=UPI003F5E5F89
MTAPFLDQRDGDLFALPARGGMPASVHVFDEDSILAVNAALAIGRPLLVRGEPGTGKSQLARAAAEGLRRAFVPHAVDARTETRDLLWSVDAVARLAEAQVLGALRHVERNEVRRRIDVLEFVQPGPLWWAFDWDSARAQAGRSGVPEPVTPEGWTPERGAVVLIDEIDKADAAVPNGLLDALGHGRFDVPGREAVTLNRACSPLVVITTNEERALPDAFLRRCLVLHLALPDDDRALVRALITRGRAHFSECAERVLQRAAELLAADRAELCRQDLAPPGVAEYIDLVRAVTEQREDEAEQIALLERIAKFALRKHPPEPVR